MKNELLLQSKHLKVAKESCVHIKWFVLGNCQFLDVWCCDPIFCMDVRCGVLGIGIVSFL